MLRLVYHTLYLAVAAKGYPTESVLCTFIFVCTVLFLLGRDNLAVFVNLATQPAPPVELGGEQGELPIEENIELIYPYTEEF